jgi:hypothetical protein
MKLVNVQLAQSLVAVIPNRGLGYLPDSAKTVVDRYKFLEFPTSPHEFFPTDPNGSINFRHGKIELNGRTIVIGWLQVFQTGISVSTDSDTRDSDLVLDDVLKWTAATFNLEFRTVRPVGHTSQLIIELKRTLADSFPKLKPVAASIQPHIDDFFPTKPQYELTSMTFHFDPTAHPSFAPSALRIEPRVNTPFAERLYYSEASLSTADHLEFLELFERTVA